MQCVSLNTSILTDIYKFKIKVFRKTVLYLINLRRILTLNYL